MVFYLPCLLHTTALLIGLFVQTMSSPLAGAWLLFHLAGCAVLLYTSKPEKQRGAVWHGCLAWLVALGLSAFIFAPVRGGAATMWILAAMPMLALCLREEHLQGYLIGFGAVALLFAVNIISQAALGVQYSFTDTEAGYAWPLIDPNNAAAFLNMALIPAFAIMLARPRWALAVMPLALALCLTDSRAGLLIAVGCCSIIAARHASKKTVWRVVAVAVGVLLILPPSFWIGGLGSLMQRFPIWEASASLIAVKPWSGLGLGTFSYYYAQVQTESDVRFYAHNDLLQFIIEAGIACTMAFVWLVAVVALTTTRRNIVAACVMLAVFLGAMVEFQFYLPPISIMMGLALAYHRLTKE